ncbi:MAG: RNA pseudouridine synthase [bacterium]|nr:RNA pseudouridine synthase [bacterium]
MDGNSAKAPQVLFWDDVLAVIAKPVGMPSQPDKSGAFSVLGWMRKRGEAYPVQRLDRPAAGLMCAARTREAAAFLSAALQRGEISKHYLALAENPAYFASGAGGPCVSSAVDACGTSDAGTCGADGVYALSRCGAPSHELRCYLRRDGRANKSEATDNAAPGFKEAILRYEVLVIGRTRALLRIELLTGRHHQIRAQLSHIGCPLAGDVKYGATSRLRQGGIALFSCRLSLPHPDGRKLSFTALPTGRAWEPFLDAVKAELLN